MPLNSPRILRRRAPSPVCHAVSRRRSTPAAAAVAILAAMLVAACGTGEGERPPRDSTASASASEETSTATSAAGASGAPPPCLLEGDWTPCAVEDRLLHAGVVLDRQSEPVRHPFLQVAGTVYHVGNADHQLQVFLYASDADRRRDTDALDSATASPKGTRVTWPAPPTLVTSNNLAAIVLSLNDRTVERLVLALGAGLPQPEKR